VIRRSLRNRATNAAGAISGQQTVVRANFERRRPMTRNKEAVDLIFCELNIPAGAWSLHKTSNEFFSIVEKRYTDGRVARYLPFVGVLGETLIQLTVEEFFSLVVFLKENPKHYLRFFDTKTGHSQPMDWQDFNVKMGVILKPTAKFPRA
jgi:hypothetical protein